MAVHRYGAITRGRLQLRVRQDTLDLNLFFTLLFTVELAVNAFSHWFQPFVQNPWSLLDTFIVAMSVMSLIVTNQPTGIVRILRALRVIRLFGRVKSLKKIISALTMALLPVMNVFLILFLLMGICEFSASSLQTIVWGCWISHHRHLPPSLPPSFSPFLPPPPIPIQ